MAFVPLRPAPDKVGYVGFVDDDPVYADMFAPITREALRQHEARQAVAMKALSFDDAFDQLLHPDRQPAKTLPPVSFEKPKPQGERFEDVTRRLLAPERPWTQDIPAQPLPTRDFGKALKLLLHGPTHLYTERLRGYD